MKERPILFSAPMVLALLAGRKTQTRRVVKLRTEVDEDGNDASDFVQRGVVRRPALYGSHVVPCPYGILGDRLWVRETSIISPKRWTADWALFSKECRRSDDDNDMRAVQYLATSPDREAANGYGLKVTPSIFMPRWTSRLTLEVTGVRVERVQDISEADAKAEGCSGFDPEPAAEGGTIFYRPGISGAPDPRAHYRVLWESINGADSWAANPWVWVVEFKRVGEAVG